MRKHRQRQRVAKKLGPSAVELTGDPADALAAWSAATLVVPAGHPNAGEPMALPDYGVDFLQDAVPGSSRPRASARHWPARLPTSRAHTAPTSRDRPLRRRSPARRWATRLAAWAAKPGWVYRGTGTRRCRPPATAYPARRGCWHHGARWTSWTSSGCRRTVGWCSLFGGRTTSPRPTARDQRRETRKSRPRPAVMSPRCRTPPLHGAALGAPIGSWTAARRSVALHSKRSTRRSPWLRRELTVLHEVRAGRTVGRSDNGACGVLLVPSAVALG